MVLLYTYGENRVCVVTLLQRSITIAVVKLGKHLQIWKYSGFGFNMLQRGAIALGWRDGESEPKNSDAGA